MRWIRYTVALFASVALCGGVNRQAQAELQPADIDKAIRAEWKKEKITPAPPADDARFLRRIYLDIVGTLPTPERVQTFLADKSPYKRLDAINQLLNSPRYAEYWTNYWDDLLMGRQVRAQVVDRATFKDWLKGHFEKNTPYNQFVKELLTATGQNSPGGSYARAVGLKNAPLGMAMEREMDANAAEAAKTNGKINGAVNWYLKYAQTPADLAGSVSRIFLGVQIQCAQCHDHKTEKWKQEDFRRFTSCFMQTRAVPIDRGKEIKGVRRIEIVDFMRPELRRLNRPGMKNKEDGRSEYIAATPAALDGTDFSTDPARRKALAAWITDDKNPWFAKALVNRMWGHFLGRGFVDPVDDFRETNPTTMPELLNKISQDFIANGYDLKHLIRTICSTQVYQLSSGAMQSTDPTNALWARYRLKPMNPDTLLDSLMQATEMGKALERLPNANLESLRFIMRRQFIFLFDVDEETEQKEFEGTISQALMLLNGNLVHRAASPIPGTALETTLRMTGDDAEKITALYLRTLSRKPTQAELTYWKTFVNAPREVVQTQAPAAQAPLLNRRMGQREIPLKQQNRPLRRANNGPDVLGRFAGRMNRVPPTAQQQAYEDLFWTLLNSSEFIFNH